MPSEPKKPSNPTQFTIKRIEPVDKQAPPIWMVSFLGIYALSTAILGLILFFWTYLIGFESDHTLLRYLAIFFVAMGFSLALIGSNIYQNLIFLVFVFNIKWLSTFYGAFLALDSRFSNKFAFYILFTDAIWLPFFVPIVWYLIKESQNTESAQTPEPVEIALSQFFTNKGQSLLQLSNQCPVLMVFLRHFGCTYCRETLFEIAQKKSNKKLDPATKLVFVHMGTDDEAFVFMSKYNLEAELRVSDKNCELYRSFNLQRGNLGQVFGMKSWLRAVELLAKGIKPGKLVGDGFRMPGVFLVYQGQILKEFRHKSVADVPHYEFMSACRVTDV